MKFNQNTKYDIIGIGATPLDTLMIIENFPNGREVHPTLDFICSSGGPVGTALSTASKLGSKTIMIDKISDDIIGKSILSDYLKYDVDTSYIQIEKNKQSASATILVKKSTGDRAIYFTPSTTTELSDISPFIDVIKNSKILHINGRHKQILSDAITIAKNYNVKISFDGGANRYNEFNDLLAQKSDICILAKDFANKYTNEIDTIKALKIIIEKGSYIAGITLGDKGSYIMNNNYNIIYQPAFKQKNIIDTTGCGDSYHGAFLYGLINNFSLTQTTQIASAVASINTQKLGSRGNLPNLTELKHFLKNNYIVI